MQQLQRKYYFKNMQDQVTRFINMCENCKKAKYDRHPPVTPLMHTETPRKPFEKLHIDTFVVENQNFLTLVDAFSKFGQAIPIKSKHRRSFSNIFPFHFFARHYNIR